MTTGHSLDVHNQSPVGTNVAPWATAASSSTARRPGMTAAARGFMHALT